MRALRRAFLSLKHTCLPAEYTAHELTMANYAIGSSNHEAVHAWLVQEVALYRPLCSRGEAPLLSFRIRKWSINYLQLRPPCQAHRTSAQCSWFFTCGCFAKSRSLPGRATQAGRAPGPSRCMACVRPNNSKSAPAALIILFQVSLLGLFFEIVRGHVQSLGA